MNFSLNLEQLKFLGFLNINRKLIGLPSDAQQIRIRRENELKQILKESSSFKVRFDFKLVAIALPDIGNWMAKRNKYNNITSFRRQYYYLKYFKLNVLPWEIQINQMKS